MQQQESMIALAVIDDSQILTPTPKDKDLTIGKLILSINVITIILTFLPVLLDFPSIYRQEWFGVADLIRLLEPLLILPLNLAVFLQGISEPVILERKSTKLNVGLIIWFGISAALYQQGAGYHSGAAMFKQVFRNIKDEVALKVADADINKLALDAYDYSREVWEHTISHYMYALGGVLLSFLNAFMFRKHGALELSRLSKLIWILCILTYGVTIAAVAIQYPYGGIPGFILIVVYGIGILGFYLIRKPGWKIPGRYLVIQHYICSYLLALVILVPWTILYGVKGRNNGAGS